MRDDMPKAGPKLGIDTAAIWAEVQANRQKLDKCRGPHEFKPIDETNPLKKWQCDRCKGIVDATNARWYLKGLQHGRTR